MARTCGIHGDDTSSGRCPTCDRITGAVADAKALVDADLQGTSPQDLLALADRAVRMAAGMREHIVAGSLLDAWAAADWLGDLAQEVKAALPVSSQDILAAVEGDTLPPRPPLPAQARRVPPDSPGTRRGPEGGPP